MCYVNMNALKKYSAYLMVKKGGGFNVSEAEKLQNPGPLNFNDSYYFTGHDSRGSALVTRIGFRGNGSTELWFDMLLPETGPISLPRGNHPRGEGISCGPVKYSCIDPGAVWEIVCTGPMLVSGKENDIFLTARFFASTPVIDFKRHTDSMSLAKYLAGQKWSREWFNKLKDLSQVHYEQGGSLHGRIAVNGKDQVFELRALRDHSFGIRDWNAMRRHAWISVLFDDGRVLNISMVSYSFLPFMHSGYLAGNNYILPVTDASDFSAIFSPPLQGKSSDLNFTVNGGLHARLIMSVENELVYTMGTSYIVHEGIADFTLGCVQGRGIYEYGFNRDSI